MSSFHERKAPDKKKGKQKRNAKKDRKKGTQKRNALDSNIGMHFISKKQYT